MPLVRTIVMTGGPCAGKSTALLAVSNALQRRGFTVLTIAETATELIGGGVAPWTCESPTRYQELQMGLQLAKEDAWREAAAGMPGRVIVLQDRGVLDGHAYMEDAPFYAALAQFGLTETEVLARYDAVFHLETAAASAIEGDGFYTIDNNSARIETPAEALELDRATFDAWSAHPCLTVIRTDADFGVKVDHLIDAVLAVCE